MSEWHGEDRIIVDALESGRSDEKRLNNRAVESVACICGGFCRTGLAGRSRKCYAAGGRSVNANGQ